MGWLFAIALFIVGSINGNLDMLMASGLYAIAGAIAFRNK